MEKIRPAETARRMILMVSGVISLELFNKVPSMSAAANLYFKNMSSFGKVFLLYVRKDKLSTGLDYFGYRKIQMYG